MDEQHKNITEGLNSTLNNVQEQLNNIDDNPYDLVEEMDYLDDEVFVEENNKNGNNNGEQQQ